MEMQNNHAQNEVVLPSLAAKDCDLKLSSNLTIFPDILIGIKSPTETINVIVNANQLISAIDSVMPRDCSKPPNARPIIVCLCGSTRFMDAFFAAGWQETLKGKIVLSVGVCKYAEHHGREALGEEVAQMLDQLHLRKIDMADEVLVLNVGGYIGKSTANEVGYAKAHNKPINWLEETLLVDSKHLLDDAIKRHAGRKPGDSAQPKEPNAK
jgi:hypothetical protein